MYTRTSHVLEIRLDNDEDDSIVCGDDGCCCWARENEEGEDDLKKNDRKRVNLFLCEPGRFIGGLLFDKFEVENVESLLAVGLTVVLLSVNGTPNVRDVDNDDETIELLILRKNRIIWKAWISIP